METDDLLYVILQFTSAGELAQAVSELMEEGWQLHGDLKLQAGADLSSPTLGSIFYVQAMWRKKPRPAPTVMRKESHRDDDVY